MPTQIFAGESWFGGGYPANLAFESLFDAPINTLVYSNEIDLVDFGVGWATTPGTLAPISGISGTNPQLRVKPSGGSWGAWSSSAQPVAANSSIQLRTTTTAIQGQRLEVTMNTGSGSNWGSWNIHSVPQVVSQIVQVGPGRAFTQIQAALNAQGFAGTVFEIDAGNTYNWFRVSGDAFSGNAARTGSQAAPIVFKTVGSGFVTIDGGANPNLYLPSPITVHESNFIRFEGNFQTAITAAGTVSVSGISTPQPNGSLFSGAAFSGGAGGDINKQYVLSDGTRWIYTTWGGYQKLGSITAMRIKGHGIQIDGYNSTGMDITGVNGHGILCDDQRCGDVSITKAVIHHVGALTGSTGNPQHGIYLASDPYAFPLSMQTVRQSQIRDYLGNGIKSRAVRTEVQNNIFRMGSDPSTFVGFQHSGCELYRPEFQSYSTNFSGNIVLSNGNFQMVWLGTDGTGGPKTKALIEKNAFIGNAGYDSTVNAPVYQGVPFIHIKGTDALADNRPVMDSVVIRSNQFSANNPGNNPLKIVRETMRAGHWLNGRKVVFDGNIMTPNSFVYDAITYANTAITGQVTPATQTYHAVVNPNTPNFAAPLNEMLTVATQQAPALPAGYALDFAATPVSYTPAYSVGVGVPTLTTLSGANNIGVVIGVPQPDITSTNNTSGQHGVAGTFQATATSGTPPYTWSLSGAPAGVTINTTTGMISWTVGVP